jgi:hypothetical protein
MGLPLAAVGGARDSEAVTVFSASPRPPAGEPSPGHLAVRAARESRWLFGETLSPTGPSLWAAAAGDKPGLGTSS